MLLMTINMLRSYMDDAPIVNGVAMSSTVESAADMGTFNFGFCNQRNIECLFHNKSACKFGVIDVMRMRKANEHIFDWGNIPSKIPPNFPIHYQPNQHVPQLLPTRPELARKMLGIPGIFAAVSLSAAYVFDLNEQMLSPDEVLRQHVDLGLIGGAALAQIAVGMQVELRLVRK